MILTPTMHGDDVSVISCVSIIFALKAPSIQNLPKNHLSVQCSYYNKFTWHEQIS